MTEFHSDKNSELLNFCIIIKFAEIGGEIIGDVYTRTQFSKPRP